MRTALTAAVVALLAASSAHAQSRGELLYSTHCIGCHTTKLHWRDGRTATNWPSLVAQVAKWQSANSLAWSEPDVLAVANYLNESIYHFAPLAPSPAASTGTARR